jgi:hypothetical protein
VSKYHVLPATENTRNATSHQRRQSRREQRAKTEARQIVAARRD